MKFTKHIHILHLLSTIPPLVPIPAAIPKNESGFGQQFYKSPLNSADAETAWDMIFTYIYEHWSTPGPVVAPLTKVEQDEYLNCVELLRMPYDEMIVKLKSLPPYFPEVIFPIAVARYMLAILKLPVRHQYLKTFPEFHLRYSSILDAVRVGTLVGAQK